MNRIHTHYDCLNVAPTASDAVIRAAYRALSQQYHPDRNPGADAHQMMSNINQAYAVLSDPAQRRAYDAWLAAQQQRQTAAAAPSHAAEVKRIATQGHRRKHAWLQWVGMGAVVGLLVGGWWWWRQQQPAPEVSAVAEAPALSPGFAPNNQPLPAVKGYVPGYPILRQQGGNVVNVDNSALPSGVFAQIYELHNGKLTAIRSFYIPAGESFEVENIGDGDFSLHYRRVDTGQWQISDPWQIKNSERSKQYRQIDVML